MKKLSTVAELELSLCGCRPKIERMDLPTALRRYQGVARASMLYDLGVRQTDIARALDAGTVLRPRRGWIAHIKADAELIAAARNGVVLTCITQARRLGLWVREEPSTHVAARTPVSRAEAAGCTIHWGKPILPRPPDSLEDPLENVLSFVADCQPFEAALAIWESALNKQLVVPGQLQALPLRKRARLLLADSTPFSDSGLETLFLSRLRWLQVRIVPQAWVDGHKVDFLIGKYLVVQIDGGHHVGPQRTSDNRHDSRLALSGYTVLRIGYDQVLNDWPTVQHEIMTAFSQGLHLRRRGIASD